LTCAHGGAWNLTYPYDSLPAFNKAWEIGSDAVKGDFRVSLDNIGMVMHSSPVEIYESFNCWGKKVEEMTAAECKQCKMLNTEYNFITASEFLAWGLGKSNVMFCVKEERDIPRAISTLIENKATNRAFLEVHLDALLNVVASNVDGWDKVYYVMNINSIDEFNRFSFLFLCFENLQYLLKKKTKYEDLSSPLLIC
jgi:glycerophosphoryl diester phosphodiesterase